MLRRLGKGIWGFFKKKSIWKRKIMSPLIFFFVQAFPLLYAHFLCIVPLTSDYAGSRYSATRCGIHRPPRCCCVLANGQGLAARGGMVWCVAMGVCNEKRERSVNDNDTIAQCQHAPGLKPASSAKANGELGAINHQQSALIQSKAAEPMWNR